MFRLLDIKKLNLQTQILPRLKLLDEFVFLQAQLEPAVFALTRAQSLYL